MPSEYERGYISGLVDCLNIISDIEDKAFNALAFAEPHEDRDLLFEKIVGMRKSREAIYKHLGEFKNGKQSCSR